MPNWNGVPIPEPSQVKIPNSIPQNFNWNSYVSDPTGTFNRFKGAREVNRVNWKGYRTAAANTKKVILSSPSKRVLNAAMQQVRSLRRARRTAEQTKKVADATKKAADNFKKVQDLLFKKLPGSDQFDKAARIGGILGILAAIGTVALLKLQEFISDRTFDNLDAISNDLTKTNQIAVQNGLKLKQIQSKIDKFDKELDANAKDFAKLNKQTEKIGQQIVEAKKQANDALYEIRRGREILEDKITSTQKKINEALYEARQNINKLQEKTSIAISNAISNVKKEIVDAMGNSKTVDPKITNAIDKAVATQDKKIAAIEAKVNAPTGNISGIQSQLDRFQKLIESEGAFTRNTRDVLFNEIDKLKKTVSDGDRAALTAFQDKLNNELMKVYLKQDLLKADISKLLLTPNTALLDAKIAELSKLWYDSKGLLQAEFNRAMAESQKQQEALSNSLQQKIDTLQRQEAPVTAQKIADLQGRIKTVEQKSGDNFVILTKLNDQIVAVQEAQKKDVEYVLTYTNDQLTRVLQNVDGKLIDVEVRAYERAKNNLSPQITKMETGLQEIERSGAAQADKTAKQIEDLKQADKDLAAVITPLIPKIKEIEPKVKDLEKKQQEQEKVNSAALPKLDEIINRLPFIPALTAAAIRPDIPTIPQIENAAATGTCRTTQPGGCMRRALDDSVANINQNTNNRVNALDIANAGMNGALLIGQQTILNRLGDQLPGGIGGKLSRFADWMHLDRVLNILILAATIHNALMLSNDIGQTLIGAINNVLQLIGLKKENGEAFDIGSVISSSIENLIKGVIGSDNYVELKEAWAKANRVYQASVNVLNTFQGLSSAILTGLEMTAGKVAKIGNALRKSGEVLENAYGWMNPQPKFNRVTQFLENLQNGASTIQMVTQAPLDVINATTELTNATTELTNAIKNDNNEVNKGKEAPEPEQLKATEATAKTASAGLEMIDLDLEADD